jgi:UDP-hydrolysing UDP-N-acetyl-D-glucosamine 2-epimerase
MNIPVAHVQGGEITGSIDEKVRHAVSKLSNLHFAATQLSCDRLVRMGEDPDTVFLTGCPSIDLAADVVQDSNFQFNPFEKYGGVGPIVDLSNGYIVVMQHPVTTQFRDSKVQINATLEAIETVDLPTLLFWPNVDAGADGISRGIRAFREQGRGQKIHYFKNMDPEDFLYLVHNSRVIVGNSSVGVRECSYMGTPAVNIGERQTGREKGANVMDVDHDPRKIRDAITKQISNGRYPSEQIYGDGKAGKRIGDLLSRSELRIAKSLAY